MCGFEREKDFVGFTEQVWKGFLYKTVVNIGQFV
jgi:hypothetical protein